MSYIIPTLTLTPPVVTLHPEQGAEEHFTLEHQRCYYCHGSTTILSDLHAARGLTFTTCPMCAGTGELTCTISVRWSRPK